MSERTRAYIDFLNQTISTIQKLCDVELTREEKMKLRFGINDAIYDVITVANERELEEKRRNDIRSIGAGSN